VFVCDRGRCRRCVYTCRLSIAARVVSDINRSFDELVNELSCIGKVITALSRLINHYDG